LGIKQGLPVLCALNLNIIGLEKESNVYSNVKQINEYHHHRRLAQLTLSQLPAPATSSSHPIQHLMNIIFDL
jgi:hypothetical protein